MNSKTVGNADVFTLATSVREHVRYSYLPALRRCVDAGLCWFGDNGRGKLILTEKGAAAIAAIK